MTVCCPRCSTRYRLPPRSRLGRNPTYRCTRCRHVFAPDEAAEAPALDAEDELALDVDLDDDEPAFTIEAARPATPDDDESDEDDAVPAPRRRASRSGAPPSPGTTARFAVRAAATVTLVYALTSVYLHTHPARTRTLLEAVPLIGTELSETRLQPGDIELADVRGDFERVQNGRLAFVITGVAINNAPVAVGGIQIEGRIVGAEEHSQVVFCGAAPNDVHELGAREIELLQTLKPTAEWQLAPGAQERFLVAFVDPPIPLHEFVAEVVAVRGASRRGAGALAKVR